MTSAEKKVKTVYPDAKWDGGWVTLPVKYDWSTFLPPTQYVTGIWAEGKCLAFGGKIESFLWRRAWKAIQCDMIAELSR